MFFWQFFIAEHHEHHLFWRDPEPLLHCLSPQGYFNVVEVAAVYCMKWDGQTLNLYPQIYSKDLIQRAI